MVRVHKDPLYLCRCFTRTHRPLLYILSPLCISYLGTTFYRKDRRLFFFSIYSAMHVTLFMLKSKH